MRKITIPSNINENKIGLMNEKRERERDLRKKK